MNKTSQKVYKKPREIYHKKKNSNILKFDDIKLNLENNNRENIQQNPSSTPIKSKNCIPKFHLIQGQSPIISKNNKIIMIMENKFHKAKRDKSPFFISDKINLRNEFKFNNIKKVKKIKHLGLCDYYSKNNEKKVTYEDIFDNNPSKTPRFNQD